MHDTQNRSASERNPELMKIFHLAYDHFGDPGWWPAKTRVEIIVGAVLTETVFAWPGMGRLLYEAIQGRDTPIITCIFIITSVMVIITNLIVDVSYRFLDPRIQRR